METVYKETDFGTMNKICGKCKIRKQVDEFYTDKVRKGGRAWQCKKCSSIRYKAYYKTEAGRAARARADARYRKKNPLRVAKWARDYYIKTRGARFKENMLIDLNKKIETMRRHLFIAARQLRMVENDKGDDFYIYDEIERLMKDAGHLPAWEEYYLDKEAHIVRRKICVEPKHLRSFIKSLGGDI